MGTYLVDWVGDGAFWVAPLETVAVEYEGGGSLVM